jgi:modulator of FtsH protease HflK
MTLACCQNQQVVRNMKSPEKDPWTGQPKQPTRRPTSVKLKKWLQYFKTWELRVRSSNLFSSKKGRNTFSMNKYTLLGIMLNLLFYWIFWGFYVIHPGEQAVITRFGRYYQTKKAEGFHWRIRGIDQLFKIETGKLKNTMQMVPVFTSDNYFISIKLKIQYRIQVAHRYLFALTKPLDYLQYTALSLVQNQLSQYPLNHLFDPETLASIRAHIFKDLHEILDRERIGLELVEVALPILQIPESLQTAFEATQQAKKEAQNQQQQARIESVQAMQTAELKVASIKREAENYRQWVVAQTQSDIERLLTLLPFYQKAPQLTLDLFYNPVLGFNKKIRADEQLATKLSKFSAPKEALE